MKPSTGAYEAARGAIQQATRSGREAAAFARLSQAVGFTDEQAWALARADMDIVGYIRVDLFFGGAR